MEFNIITALCICTLNKWTNGSMPLCSRATNYLRVGVQLFRPPASET